MLPPPSVPSEVLLPRVKGLSGLQNGVERLRFICVDLRYTPYRDHSGQQDYFHPCEIHFKDLRGEYITVPAALSRVLRHMGCYALAHATSFLLPDDVPSKLAIAFHFPGCEPCWRQIPSKENGEPLCQNFIAFKVAMEMKTYMDLARLAGKPLRHNGQEVQVDKLVLKRLYRVSKDAWQPEFMIWC